MANVSNIQADLYYLLGKVEILKDIHAMRDLELENYDDLPKFQKYIKSFCGNKEVESYAPLFYKIYRMKIILEFIYRNVEKKPFCVEIFLEEVEANFIAYHLDNTPIISYVYDLNKGTSTKHMKFKSIKDNLYLLESIKNVQNYGYYQPLNID